MTLWPTLRGRGTASRPPDSLPGLVVRFRASITQVAGLRPVLGIFPVSHTVPITIPAATITFMNPPRWAHKGAVFHSTNPTTAPAPICVIV
jgi:hypothetical protein